MWLFKDFLTFPQEICKGKLIFLFIVRNIDWKGKTIVIRNGKIVWKHGPYCWYFCLNLKYLGWPYSAYIKKAKNGEFCEELLSESVVEVVLATFCYCDYDAKALSKRVSQMLFVFYNMLNSQNIATYQSKGNSKKWLVTRICPAKLKSCWSCTEKRAITDPWWVLSIMEVI